MPRRGSAKRHAQAVFDIARERQELERWQADLERLGQVAADLRYRGVLENPKLSLKDKLAVLGDKLAGLNPLAVNLLALLLARGRLGLAPAIAEEYQRLLNAHWGVEGAEVITAIPLEDPEKERLTRHLGKLAGKKVILTTRVDPAILGGLIARLGDRLVDGSVRSRLVALKKSLVGTGR